MPATSIEAIRRRLRGLSASDHRKIARSTGVPYDTLRKITYGMTASPRYRTYAALERWYRGARA